MIDIETILTYLTLISVPVGVFYHIMMLRNAQQAGQTQLLMQIHQTKADQQTMLNYFTMLTMDWKNPEDFQQKYVYTNREYVALVESNLSYFEGLGILVKDKKIDADTVYKLMGRRILQLWARFEDMIHYWREMDHGPGPDYNENYEYLVGEMVKIRKEKGLPMYEGRLAPNPLFNNNPK